MPDHRGLTYYDRLVSGEAVPLDKIVGVGLRGLPSNLRVLWGIAIGRFAVKDDKLVNLKVY